MERLSKKCTAILLGALTCLAAGIMLAPRVDMPQLGMERSAQKGAGQGADAADLMMRSCAGGASLSCHPQRYQPRL